MKPWNGWRHCHYRVLREITGAEAARCQLAFFLCVGVFTQTAFALASPHLRAVLAARLFFRRCEWTLSRSLAPVEPESPAWRRIFHRPTLGDESAGFLQLIGVFGKELAAVSKPASSVVGGQGGPFAGRGVRVPSRTCQNVIQTTYICMGSGTFI